MATVTKAANAHDVVNTGWTTPSNAYATTGDNSYATAAPAKNSVVEGDFGFADITSADIPDSSTINSVTYTLEWAMTALVTGGTLGCTPLNNGSQTGNDVTKTTIAEAQASAPYDQAVPTLSDLRSASTLLKARIRCSKGNTNTAMTGRLDFVSMTVDFTAPAGGQDMVDPMGATGFFGL